MYQVSDAYKAAIISGERKMVGQITDTKGTVILGQTQLQNIEIEQAANSGDDLTLGSYLSDRITVTAVDPDGAIAAMPWGEMEFVPWLGVETADGPEMVPMGVFTAGAAETENDAPVVKIEAQDRAILLETTWTTEGETWPMTLAQMVARACEVAGVELGSAEFPNASLPIEQGAAVETTARAMVAYAAQAAGGFARMGRDGKLYIQGYAQTDRAIGAENLFRQLVGKYTVPAIDQVLVLAEEGDLGMAYPENIEAKHPYKIIDNPLLYALTASPKEEQQAAVKAIYDEASRLPYIPQEIECQGDPSIGAGDIITVYNRYGEATALPIMEYKIIYDGGAHAEMRCVGSSPDQPQAQGPLTESVIALRQKSNVIQRELDYTRSEIKEVSHTADAIVTEVTELTQRVDGLVLSASRTGGANRIKGSSGRLGLDDWQVDGQVVCDTSTAVYNFTAAGGCFVLGLTGRLGQTIPTVAGKRYAYYCQYKLETGASTSAYISHGGQRRELAAAEEWTEITGSFVADSPAALVEAMVEGGTLWIADWTVIQGEVCTAWQQAQNEIDAGGVQITSRGIDITKEGDPFQASLDNQQVRFRNTDTGEDVAYFNKDSGRIRQLSALGEFTVQQPDTLSGALRVIPVAGGAFFVIND